MQKSFATLMLAGTLALTGCNEAEKSNEKVIGKFTGKVENGILSPS